MSGYRAGMVIRPAEQWRADALDLMERYLTRDDTAALRRAVSLFHAAARALSDHDPLKRAVLNNLCVASRLLYDETDEVDALQEAVTAGRWATLHTAPAQRSAASMSNFGTALRLLGVRLADAALLREAVEVGRIAVSLPQPDHDLRIGIRDQFREALVAAHEYDGNPAPLAELVQLAQGTVVMLPPFDSRRVEWLHSLGKRALSLFQRTRDPDMLSVALGAARAGVNESAPTDEHRADHLWLIGDVLLSVYESSRQRPALQEAVAALRGAVSNRAGTDIARAIRRVTLGRALLILYLAAPDVALLHEAVATYREAFKLGEAMPSVGRDLQLALRSLAGVTGSIDLRREIVAVGLRAARAPVGTPKRLDCLIEVVVAARWIFDEAGDVAMLTESVTAGRAVLKDPSVTLDQYLRGVTELQQSLRTRYNRTGDRAPLLESIDALRSVLGSTSYAGRDLSAVRYALGSCLLALAQATGDGSHLDDACLLLQRASEGASDGAERAFYAANLGGALLGRYEMRGDPATLDAAIELLRPLIGAAEARSQGLAATNLATALLARFQRTGRMADLDETINLCRARLASGGLAAINLSNLGVALAYRAKRTGRIDLLRESVETMQQAVDATPVADVQRPVYVNNLVVALMNLADRADEPRHRDEAIMLARSQIAATGGDSVAGTAVLGNLGQALSERYYATRDITAGLEAVRVLRDTAARIGAGADRATALTNLAQVQFVVSRQGRDQVGMADAIATCRELLAAADAGSPGQASISAKLAGMLRTRWEDDRDEAAFDEATLLYAVAAGAQAARPVARVESGQALGALFGGRGRWTPALAAYRHAIELLPQVAPRAIEHTDRQYQLTGLSGLASDAAAVALQLGLVDTAVELLEQGRGILLGRLFEGQVGLAALRAARPDRAEEFERLVGLLNVARPDDGLNLGWSGGAGRSWFDSRRQEQLSADLDELLAEIRTLPGLARFLLPPERSALTAAAAHGPIVLVNVSRYRCDALVLTPDGATCVELPALTPRKVAELINSLFASDEGSISAAAVPHPDRIVEVLGWLWDHVAGPVLAAAQPPATADGRPGRLWWCPTGLLGLLPLPAAGHHGAEGGDRTVLHRVVSSVTPTVGALTAVRGRRAEPTTAAEAALLVVSMPHTPGADDLPGVEDEEAQLRARFADAVVLREEQATRDTVLAALHSHPSVHFACHATSSWDDPARSTLLLSDHETRPLLVGDIARQLTSAAGIAYLSACGTTQISPQHADETVHIAAACQLAGYASVVGTLWPTNDFAAARIAQHFYDELGTGDADQAAAALHRAALRARDEFPQAPQLWAAYVHSGV
jgi:tetratricopeptide (TPR) repeat protein